MDGFITSSAALSADGVQVLEDPALLDAAGAVLCAHFPDNIPEILATLRRDAACKNGFGCRVRTVVGCVDAAGTVQAAAVCLTKKLPKGTLVVVEIVWFAALTRRQGWGSALFRGVMRAAQGIRADAVLSSSTNAALPFWLSRPDVRIAGTVLRCADRAALPLPSECGFRMRASPDSAGLERLYAEAIVRNRKGRMVGAFEGKPYHYCVATSNHVWYPLNAGLRIPTTLARKSEPAEAEPELALEVVEVGALAGKGAAAPPSSPVAAACVVTLVRRPRAPSVATESA